MAKKKILVDIFYLHVAQTGIKTYIECLCDEIENHASEDFEFMLSPSRQSIRKSTFFKGKTKFWKNLFYQGIYFFRKLVVLPWLSLRYQAHIVFSPDILSPLWAKGKKVSVIHDAFFWESPSHYHPIWLKVYLAFLNASLARNAHVITVSKHSKKQLQRYLDVSDANIDVVYPSSGLIQRNARRETPPLVEKPYFLHVGVMEKRKNLTMLVHAFAGFVKQQYFEDYRLVLVGQPGPRKHLDDYDNIQSLIQQYQLEEKVVLTGYVSQVALESYYQHALGYVFPSLNEGFGMPVLEAFSYGLPVIIADQGTLVEVGGDAVLKVAENTPTGLEASLTLLARDEQLRKEMVERGYRRLGQFSSADFFLSLQHCFRKILNE
jgi:glycosyltransferase involved in cell wall biosynthesis